MGVRGRILVSIIIITLCLLSVYPLLVEQLDDYSTLTFIAYYRAFLWLLWSTITLIFGVIVFAYSDVRKKYWKFFVLNFTIILAIVVIASIKVQMENQEQVRQGKIIQP